MHFKFILAYVQRVRKSYLNASKKEKSWILDHAQEFTGISRKRLIRLFNDPSILNQSHAKKRGSGRPSPYERKSFQKHLIELWKLAERLAPGRFKESIPLWIKSYQKHYGPIDSKDLELLEKVSASTIGRILALYKKHENQAKTSTRPNLKLKPLIPIKRLDEEVSSPGTVQTDTVAHCGSALLGEYANTLTLVDIYSGWTENRAIFTKDSKQIKCQLESIELKLPFQMKYFDTDCGTEFLNYRIIRYLENRKAPIKMRRSRPYHKDDQAYVEQRNFTHVRNLFGYERLDNPNLIKLMNEIYQDYWNPLHNYFLPSYKLESKTREGGKIKKKFKRPKTPAQRLIDSSDVNSWRKRKLKSEITNMDPIELKKGLEKKLDLFFKLLKESKNRRIA